MKAKIEIPSAEEGMTIKFRLPIITIHNGKGDDEKKKSRNGLERIMNWAGEEGARVFIIWICNGILPADTEVDKHHRFVPTQPVFMGEGNQELNNSNFISFTALLS